MFNKKNIGDKGMKLKDFKKLQGGWSKVIIDGDEVWTQTPRETKTFYKKLNKLKGDDLTLEIAKPFLPKRVLKMTRENQLKHINKSSQKFCDALPDIKFTKLGEVKEKNRFGQWEYV